MVVLGLDPSLTGTGFSVIDNDKLLFSECYKPKNKTGPKRLIEIGCKISEVIDAYKPELICLEGYSFGSRGRALFQIGELGGLIRVLLHKTGIKWLEITPSQVKKFAAGVGNCGKDIIMQQVYKRWGMEFKTSDEADAFVLAKIGTVLLGHKEELIKAQEEVIGVLEDSKAKIS